MVNTWSDVAETPSAPKTGSFQWYSTTMLPSKGLNSATICSMSPIGNSTCMESEWVLPSSYIHLTNSYPRLAEAENSRS